MHNTSWLLERAGERFEMREPAIERLVRRRARKTRSRQLVTAAVALGVSILGVRVAIVALRTRSSVVPASGFAPEPVGSGDRGWAAFLLPSVAIWAAVGALPLAILAVGRIKHRGATTSLRVAEESRARIVTRTTPTGLPPASVKGNGRKEGTMGTHVESFPARHTARNVWVTVGVLALLALAIGTGVAIGRATVEESVPPPMPEGLASTAVVQAIDSNTAALNAADADALAATFATNAVFTDTIAGLETVGADEIAAVYTEDTLPGEWELQRTSEVVQIGNYASNAFTYASGSGIAVFQLDGDLKVVHQWVMGI
jgi:hypothetical protein